MTKDLTPLRTFLRLPQLGLVEQLRLVFGLIVLVIGVAVFSALWQFKILGDAQSKLVKTSVPVLVRTQMVERALHDLVISLAEIEVTPSQQELAKIGRNVNEQLIVARRSVAGLSGSDTQVLQTDPILRKLSLFENGIQTNLATKHELFQGEETLQTYLTHLTQKRNNIRIIVEQMSFEASQAMDANVEQIFAYRGDDVDAVTKRLGDQTRLVSLIAQLALEIETIANVVGQLGNKASPEKLNDTRNFLEFRMRGALHLIVRLPATPARKELSVLISNLKETTFGEDGILNQIDEYASRTRDLAQQNGLQQVIVRDITAATERLMASAHGQLVDAGLVTQLTKQRLILILAITAIVVAIIVMLSILIIVERQINLRIGLLTGSVVRIATGDTEHETQVFGQDELGRMANALETFKRNARELLRSNAELEKFAYAAAHDLRSPLQAIHDLTVWTIEDDENRLSADSAENLQLVQVRVARLSALLGDLLQYARVGTDIAEPSLVDWDAAVSEMALMADPSGDFQVTHDWTGGDIETYPHPLQKVLLNLMNNTLKHHGSGKGHIHILSVMKGDRLWVEYTDDGPGIPPEYHTKVFDLFQTLKPRDEMEGSGLGLAITQKLIEHYDGSVCVRSDPKVQAGTTFIFDFPAKFAVEVAKAA